MVTTDRKIVVNMGILVVTIVITFLILDRFIARTGAMGGLSLAGFMEDELRIRLLTVPDNSNYGCSNGTDLVPNCQNTFYGLKVRLPGFKVRINSVGMRDREYPLEKKENVYRIFVLGDSLAWGEGVDNEDMFSEVLERLLNSQYHGTDFEVLNIAFGGTSTDGQYRRLIRYFEYSPDMVIIQSHPNDIYGCGELENEIDQTLESRGPGTIEDWQEMGFSAKIKLEELREEVAKTMTEEKRCSCVRKYLNLILNRSSAEGIPVYMYGVDFPHDEISCFSDIEVSNYQYIDAPTLMRGYRLSREDGHPNRKGHRLIADDLLPRVIAIINSTRPEMLR